MKFERRDFIKLRWALLAAVLLLALAILFAQWSLSVARQASAERNQAAARNSRIETRLRQVRTEEQEIKERTALFQRLEQSGLTGEEKRLDWIELLRNLQRELRLAGMNYEFGPQAALENLPETGYAYFSSPLKIRLRLLHEKDLLDFLDRLQREAKALVIVRSCKLSRLPSPASGPNSAASLSAECEMDWMTLRQGSKQ